MASTLYTNLIARLGYISRSVCKLIQLEVKDTQLKLGFDL